MTELIPLRHLSLRTLDSRGIRLNKHIIWKTDHRRGNKCDWRQVWASCKAPAVTPKIIQTSNSWLILAEPLHVCLDISVQYYVGGWSWDRLNAETPRPLVAAPCSSSPPPPRLPGYLLSFSALLLFISLPLKPQSSSPPIFLFLIIALQPD